METNDLISTVVPTAHKSCYCLSLRPQLELLGITAWLLPSEVTLTQNPGEDLPRPDEQVQKAAKLINACRIEALGLYSSDDLIYILSLLVWEVLLSQPQSLPGCLSPFGIFPFTPANLIQFCEKVMGNVLLVIVLSSKNKLHPLWWGI